MSVAVTVDQLLRITDRVRAEGLPVDCRLELYNSYDDSMKEHDSCVKVKFQGTDDEFTRARRYGMSSRRND